jgi:hypothetical protein
MKTKEIVNVFEDVVLEGPAVLKQGWLKKGDLNNEGPLEIGCLWERRDVSENRTAKSMTTHVCHVNGKSQVTSQFPSVAPSGTVLTSVSPSGTYVLYFKKLPASGSKKTPASFCIEVWNEHGLFKKALTEGIHGDIYTDPFFQVDLNWSADETKFVYAAEGLMKETPDMATFFPPFTSSCQVENNADAEVDRGNEFQFREDWGEAFEGKQLARLFVLSLNYTVAATTKGVSIEAVEGIPKSVSAGQACFVPTGDGIIFTGWDTPTDGDDSVSTRRLGLSSLSSFPSPPLPPSLPAPPPPPLLPPLLPLLLLPLLLPLSHFKPVIYTTLSMY